MTRMCSMTVPSQNGGPFSASAAPRITPIDQRRRRRGPSRRACRPSCSISWLRKRGIERVLHAVVMALRDTVFAVIAAELRQEGHRLLGALVDELARTARSCAWANTVRWLPSCRAGTGRAPRCRWRTSGCRSRGSARRSRARGRPRRAACAARHGRRVPRGPSVGQVVARAPRCRSAASTISDTPKRPSRSARATGSASPAPSKKAVDRSRVALAPCGSHCPNCTPAAR